MFDRRKILLAAAAGAIVPSWGLAQSGANDLAEAQRQLIFGTGAAFDAAAELIIAHGQADIAAGLILAMRYSRRPHAEFVELLEQVTGTQAGGDWNDWMLWQESHPELVPHASYAELKRDVFLRIDPNFDDFLRPEFIARDRMHIRLEEIVWGGVSKDGIPSLDNPELIAADAADYLRDDDLIFGVAINGDIRAYPLRIMGWHEMFNDVIGGVPVALAYCTLCGSGILFETDVEGRAAPLVFGSSGFLYRSNKLMFDRGSNSLWNQFTGKPVVGPMVNSGIELRQRPVVITTWSDWRGTNPTTQVLSLQTGHRRDYGSGVVYNNYFASDDLMFPALVDQSEFGQKSYVFGIRVQGEAKAWPLKYFDGPTVINDEIAGVPVVLIGDAQTRTVRAYKRRERNFSRDSRGIISDDGGLWAVSEDALISGDISLPRMAGHIAYWFAWNNYLGAESEIYRG
ncbi:MAG: DUF3179 domain-containing protein [Paracoccaceae bacterium]